MLENRKDDLETDQKAKGKVLMGRCFLGPRCFLDSLTHLGPQVREEGILQLRINPHSAVGTLRNLFVSVLRAEYGHQVSPQLSSARAPVSKQGHSPVLCFN
jgi:hypothetical protein